MPARRTLSSALLFQSSGVVLTTAPPRVALYNRRVLSGYVQATTNGDGSPLSWYACAHGRRDPTPRDARGPIAPRRRRAQPATHRRGGSLGLLRARPRRAA